MSRDLDQAPAQGPGLNPGGNRGRPRCAHMYRLLRLRPVPPSLVVQQTALEELPLLLPKAAKSSGTLLLQIAHEKFNLQGDMGAVGRLASTDKGLILDLKGVI